MYNVFIFGFGKVGDLIEVYNFLDEMKWSGCKLDVVIYSCLIMGFIKVS